MGSVHNRICLERIQKFFEQIWIRARIQKNRFRPSPNKNYPIFNFWTYEY